MKMKANDIGTVVKNVLLSDKTVAAMTTKRVYPMIAPNADTPCLIYAKDSITPSYTKDNPASYDIVNVSIVVLADKYDKMITLSNAVYDALEGFSGTIEGVDVKRTRFVSAKDEFESDVYTQIMEFEFRINN